MTNRNLIHTLLCLFLAAAYSSQSRAEVTEFTDFVEWQDAAGSFTAIDFTGIPAGTHLTNKYADIGVTFAFDFNQQVLCCDFGSFVDGAGLSAFGPPIQLMFDTPHHWIAVDFLGDVRFELYSGGNLIFTSAGFGGGGSFFGGLVSTVPFDSAIIFDPTGDDFVVIDNLYFGVPGLGALPLLAMAGMMGRRRRRR